MSRSKKYPKCHPP